MNDTISPITQQGSKLINNPVQVRQANRARNKLRFHSLTLCISLISMFCMSPKRNARKISNNFKIRGHVYGLKTKIKSQKESLFSKRFSLQRQKSKKRPKHFWGGVCCILPKPTWHGRSLVQNRFSQQRLFQP